MSNIVMNFNHQILACKQYCPQYLESLHNFPNFDMVLLYAVNRYMPVHLLAADGASRSYCVIRVWNDGMGCWYGAPPHTETIRICPPSL